MWYADTAESILKGGAFFYGVCYTDISCCLVLGDEGISIMSEKVLLEEDSSDF